MFELAVGTLVVCALYKLHKLASRIGEQTEELCVEPPDKQTRKE